MSYNIGSLLLDVGIDSSTATQSIGRIQSQYRSSLKQVTRTFTTDLAKGIGKGITEGFKDASGGVVSGMAGAITGGVKAGFADAAGGIATSLGDIVSQGIEIGIDSRVDMVTGLISGYIGNVMGGLMEYGQEQRSMNLADAVMGIGNDSNWSPTVELSEESEARFKLFDKNITEIATQLSYDRATIARLIEQLSRTGVDQKELLGGDTKSSRDQSLVSQAAYLAEAMALPAYQIEEVVKLITMSKAAYGELSNKTITSGILGVYANTAQDTQRLKYGLQDALPAASAAGISYQDTLAVITQLGKLSSFEVAGTLGKTIFNAGSNPDRVDDRIAGAVNANERFRGVEGGFLGAMKQEGQTLPQLRNTVDAIREELLKGNLGSVLGEEGKSAEYIQGLSSQAIDQQVQKLFVKLMGGSDTMVQATKGLLQQDKESEDRLQKSIESFTKGKLTDGSSVTGAFIAQKQKGVQGSLDLIGSSMNNVRKMLGQEVEPAFVTFVSFFTDVANTLTAQSGRMTGGLEEINEMFGRLFSDESFVASFSRGVQNVVTEINGVLLGWSQSIVYFLEDGDNVKNAFRSIGDNIRAVAGGFTELFKIMSAFLPVVGQFGDKLKELAQWMGDDLKGEQANQESRASYDKEVAAKGADNVRYTTGTSTLNPALERGNINIDVSDSENEGIKTGLHKTLDILTHITPLMTNQEKTVARLDVVNQETLPSIDEITKDKVIKSLEKGKFTAQTGKTATGKVNGEIITSAEYAGDARTEQAKLAREAVAEETKRIQFFNPKTDKLEKSEYLLLPSTTSGGANLARETSDGVVKGLGGKDAEENLKLLKDFNQRNDTTKAFFAANPDRIGSGGQIDLGSTGFNLLNTKERDKIEEEAVKLAEEELGLSASSVDVSKRIAQLKKEKSTALQNEKAESIFGTGVEYSGGKIVGIDDEALTFRSLSINPERARTIFDASSATGDYKGSGDLLDVYKTPQGEFTQFNPVTGEYDLNEAGIFSDLASGDYINKEQGIDQKNTFVKTTTNALGDEVKENIGLNFGFDDLMEAIKLDSEKATIDYLKDVSLKNQDSLVSKADAQFSEQILSGKEVTLKQWEQFTKENIKALQDNGELVGNTSLLIENFASAFSKKGDDASLTKEQQLVFQKSANAFKKQAALDKGVEVQTGNNAALSTTPEDASKAQKNLMEQRLKIEQDILRVKNQALAVERDSVAQIGAYNGKVSGILGEYIGLLNQANNIDFRRKTDSDSIARERKSARFSQQQQLSKLTATPEDAVNSLGETFKVYAPTSDQFLSKEIIDEQKGREEAYIKKKEALDAKAAADIKNNILKIVNFVARTARSGMETMGQVIKTLNQPGSGDGTSFTTNTASMLQSIQGQSLKAAQAIGALESVKKNSPGQFGAEQEGQLQAMKDAFDELPALITQGLEDVVSAFRDQIENFFNQAIQRQQQRDLDLARKTAQGSVGREGIIDLKAQEVQYSASINQNTQQLNQLKRQQNALARERAQLDAFSNAFGDEGFLRIKKASNTRAQIAIQGQVESNQIEGKGINDNYVKSVQVSVLNTIIKTGDSLKKLTNIFGSSSSQAASFQDKSEQLRQEQERQSDSLEALNTLYASSSSILEGNNTLSAEELKATTDYVDRMKKLANELKELSLKEITEKLKGEINTIEAKRSQNRTNDQAELLERKARLIDSQDGYGYSDDIESAGLKLQAQQIKDIASLRAIEEASLSKIKDLKNQRATNLKKLETGDFTDEGAREIAVLEEQKLAQQIAMEEEDLNRERAKTKNAMEERVELAKSETTMAGKVNAEIKKVLNGAFDSLYDTLTERGTSLGERFSKLGDDIMNQLGKIGWDMLTGKIVGWITGALTKKDKSKGMSAADRVDAQSQKLFYGDLEKPRVFDSAKDSIADLFKTSPSKLEEEQRAAQKKTLLSFDETDGNIGSSVDAQFQGFADSLAGSDLSNFLGGNSMRGIEGVASNTSYMARQQEITNSLLNQIINENSLAVKGAGKESSGDSVAKTSKEFLASDTSGLSKEGLKQGAMKAAGTSIEGIPLDPENGYWESEGKYYWKGQEIDPSNKETYAPTGTRNTLGRPTGTGVVPGDADARRKVGNVVFSPTGDMGIVGVQTGETPESMADGTGYVPATEPLYFDKNSGNRVIPSEYYKYGLGDKPSEENTAPIEKPAPNEVKEVTPIEIPNSDVPKYQIGATTNITNPSLGSLDKAGNVIILPQSLPGVGSEIKENRKLLNPIESQNYEGETPFGGYQSYRRAGVEVASSDLSGLLGSGSPILNVLEDSNMSTKDSKVAMGYVQKAAEETASSTKELTDQIKADSGVDNPDGLTNATPETPDSPGDGAGGIVEGALNSGMTGAEKVAEDVAEQTKGAKFKKGARIATDAVGIAQQAGLVDQAEGGGGIAQSIGGTLMNSGNPYAMAAGGVMMLAGSIFGKKKKKPNRYNIGVSAVPGNGTTDSVPALLTPGEAVLTRTAVERLGGRDFIEAANFGRMGFLHKNVGGMIPSHFGASSRDVARLNKGGIVKPSSLGMKKMEQPLRASYTALEANKYNKMTENQRNIEQFANESDGSGMSNKDREDNNSNMKVEFQSTVINNVSYVTETQFMEGIEGAINRSQQSMYKTLRSSPKARRQLGMR